MESVNKLGCVIVAVVDVVHPFASVAVTVYVPAVRLLRVDVVEPVFHKYEYPAVPFAANAVALPVAPPLHNTFVVDGIDSVNKLGCVIVAVVDVVHPFASVAVTVYVPAVRLLIVAAVDPVFHKYEYPDVPFAADAVTLPVAPPLHNTLVVDGTVNVNCVGCVMVVVAVFVHPRESVTVTVYVPIVRLDIVDEEPPLLQK